MCYGRGGTFDLFTVFLFVPLSKMSSAILMPSGTPPTFCVKSGSPLLSTAKASNIQCTPNQTRLRPFWTIICRSPSVKLRTFFGRTAPLLSLLMPLCSSDTECEALE